MPIVGLAGNVDFSNLYFGLNEKVRAAVDAASKAGTPLGLADARKIGPVLAYGNFITTTINFAILALCIFLVIKAFNTARKRFEKEQPACAPAGPTLTESLLMDIRDELKKKK